MAGFMSGFGNAFANSYEKAKDRRDAKEQDMFRYTFAAALDRRKEREAHDKTEGKYVSDAKALVSMEGLPNDAVADAYTMLRAGYTPEQTVKKLKGGSYAKTPDPASSPDAAGDISADPTKAAAGNQGANPNDQVTPADEQTVAAMNPAPAGLPQEVGGDPNAVASATAAPVAPAAQAPQPPASVAPATPQPAAPAPDVSAPAAQAPADVQPDANSMVPDNVRSQVEQAMGGKMDLAPVSDTPVMEPSGKFTPGPADVDNLPSAQTIQYQYDTAKTPAEKELWGAQLKAVNERIDREELAKNPQSQGIVMFKDPEGQWRTKAVRKNQDGDMVLADSGEPVPADARPVTKEEKATRDEIAKGTDVGTKVLAKQSKIISLYPDANALIQEAYAQPAVLNAVGSVSSWISSADQNIQSVKQIIETSAPESPEVDNGLKTIDSMLAKTPLGDIAQRTSLFRSKILLMGYRAGDIEGQRGNSVTEKDLTRLQQILQGADANPATFAKLMKSYMSDLTANVDVEIKSYNDSNGLAQEYEKTFGTGSAPGNAFIKPMEQVIMGADDATKQSYMDLQKAGETQVTLPEERHAPVDVSKIDPEAIAMLKAHPETADQFDAHFQMPGAADAILGKKKENIDGSK